MCVYSPPKGRKLAEWLSQWKDMRREALVLDERRAPSALKVLHCLRLQYGFTARFSRTLERASKLVSGGDGLVMGINRTGLRRLALYR